MSSLKAILSDFLSGQHTHYPTMQATIISLNPLQITDNFQNYFDISSLQEQIINRIDPRNNVNYKILLHDWSFVFRKVPNSHDYYFDIVSNNYQVIENMESFPSHGAFPTKVVDDPDIRYLFEERKRAEIEGLIRESNFFRETPGKGKHSATTKTFNLNTPSQYSKVSPQQSMTFELPHWGSGERRNQTVTKTPIGKALFKRTPGPVI